MSEAKVLSPSEETVMRESFAATMLRAAAIIDGITNADVMEAQAILFGSGCKLSDLAKLDRAMLAASYLRACAAGMSDSAAARIKELRKSLSA